jgi:hypothetical protein
MAKLKTTKNLKYILSFLICFGCLSLHGAVSAGKLAGHVSDRSNLWISDKLPKGSVLKGDWKWSDSVTQYGAKTHVQSAQVLTRYSFRTSYKASIDGRSKIIQHVYLDPVNPPMGIMLRFFTVSDEDIVFYWEGMEEVFSELDEYITAWYMGFIPEKGSWVLLEIDFKELDITQSEIEGMEFIISNGRVWWGSTIIERNN